MTNTVPGSEKLAVPLHLRPRPGPWLARRRPGRRIPLRGLALPAAFAVLAAVLFTAYLCLSRTQAENSDEANILLMASDMLHGNVILHGWNVSDVPFITTELPQIALLVWVFGLRLNTAHIAAAMTYTLVVLIGMWLAKGRASGPAAVARMLLALGIMLAPEPGAGVFVLVFSVGHIGTSVPVMLAWLVIDRLGITGGSERGEHPSRGGLGGRAVPPGGGSPGGRPPGENRVRPWLPALVTLLLAWALTADPLVLIIAVAPLAAVCLARIASAWAGAVRDGTGLSGWLPALRDRLLEAWLLAAAAAGWLLAWGAGRLISASGGYVQQPVPYALAPEPVWLAHARLVGRGLLAMFGASFGAGAAAGGLDRAIALLHLVSMALAVWAVLAAARRFFRRDADFVSQLLMAGIAANIAAYLPSTLANATVLNTREIAPVLPFAAVLAGRMLGDRMVTGNRPVTSRRPRARLLAVPLLGVLAGYCYGLGLHAAAPAAPDPYARLAASLERHHLTYGLSGYWEASLLTVDTGGAVTVRAVMQGNLQPYMWESKPEWYRPGARPANFILISSVPGYFSKFNPSARALLLLSQWYPSRKFYSFGGTRSVAGSEVAYYTVRQYPVNLLTQLPRLKAALAGG